MSRSETGTAPERHARWPDLAPEHPFGTANLPYGVFTHAGSTRVGVRVGDQVLDLAAVDVEPEVRDAWAAPSLNAFLGLHPDLWQRGREAIQSALDPGRAGRLRSHLIDLDRVELSLPVTVADYVDFYASEHHATNVGRIFRPHTDPLPASWKHLPIAYHGRSGTVVVSGTPIIRPNGQRRPTEDGAQLFGPTTKLDIEAELGFVVGGRTALGERVSVDGAHQHLFGAVLLNDWSARDIQAWEYVPLGPFLGKSFATSISAWVVPMVALASARVPLAQDHPVPLPYLRGSGAAGIDVRLQVRLNDVEIAEPRYSDMYWAPEQMLAHLSVNGASVRPGDLFGSGTISGPDKQRRGSLLELTWDGAEPIVLPDGTERGFLADGDTVTITGWAPGPSGERIGFAEVTGTIVAAPCV